MNKLKIIRFLNKEYEKIKGEPSKIRGFYSRHRDLIDDAFLGVSIPALIVSGLNPELAIVIGMAELAGWGGKKAFEERKIYGGSFWEAGSHEKGLKKVV